MPEPYRFIGKRLARKDALDIVTGKAQYFDELKVPGMIHGKILRSPHPHADILNIDTRAAERLPGVRAVLTHKNVPDWKGGLPMHVPVLDKKVRFVGDPVALVAADREDIAESALELIRVRYEKLPAVYDLDEATEPGAPQLYDEFPDNILPIEVPQFGPDAKALDRVVMGDVDAGFESADIICEGSCGYEGVPNPLPPEPPGAIARWEGVDKLTLWTATQGASYHRWVVQIMMNLANIRSISPQCGGSYGSKNWYPHICFYAAALAKAANRPVKVYYTKSEHLATFVLRPASRVHCRVGIKKDGTVTAIDGDWIVGTGAFSSAAQAQICVGCGEAQLAIRCKNWNLRSRLVVTNRNPSGTVRGFGGQEQKAAISPILALAMEKADLDPLEFFKKNYVRKGDGYYWRDSSWWVAGDIDYREAMDRGAEVFGWHEKWKGWLKPTAIEGTKRIGVGVGIHGNADSGEDRCEAWVKINPDATAVVHVCISEPGGGQRSSIVKMAAEVLQLPMDRIDVAPADTLVNPFDFGLAGSRGTYAVGSAVIAAAEDAKKKLLERFSGILGVAPEAIDISDGLVRIQNTPGDPLPWIMYLGPYHTFTGMGHFEEDYSKPNFMMQFIEVAVDTETGKVDLVQLVPAADVGQIIDPAALEGQFYGSLGSAGVDTAIFEESVIDTRSGRLVNSNLIDYKWRTFQELPVFKNSILESQLPTHRFKALGVGEITPSPGPAAVLMAVSNAVGKRLAEYPLTPEKILKALGKIKGGQ